MMPRAPLRIALAAMVLLGITASCGGDPVQPPPTTPTPIVATIQVSPSTDTLAALGDTEQLAAQARDGAGNVVPGQTFVWSSSAPSVAAVDASGLVTARGNGTAEIRASVGAIFGSAALVVAQEVAEVLVSPVSATLRTVDATRQFTAQARDANANPISGVRFLWVSSDPGVATVDTTGLAIAVDRGEVTITAAAGVPGRASLTVALRTFVQVSAGEGHSCGLTVDGEAFCWGRNVEGQLGDNSNTPSNVPVPVGGGHQFTSITAGFFHSCGVTTVGEVRCWGANASGQLGDNSNTPRNLPVPVAGSRSWIQVDAGSAHTCAIERTTAAVFCWGGNGFSQLGDGTNNPTTAPLQVPGVTATSVRAGDSHTCAVAASGAGTCWGSDLAGELGDGPATTGPGPVPVTPTVPPEPLMVVDAGTVFSCGTVQSGRGYCWGINTLGELGNGTGFGSDVPVPVSGGLGFTSIDAGVEFACGVSLTGADAYCWGDNDAFQLGNGTGIPGSGTPLLVSGALDLVAVSTGTAHACAVTTDGDAYCWGLNLAGQLGDGTNFNSATPVRVTP